MTRGFLHPSGFPDLSHFEFWEGQGFEEVPGTTTLGGR